MKYSKFSVASLAIVALIFATACKGKQGPPGTPGADGDGTGLQVTSVSVSCINSVPEVTFNTPDATETATNTIISNFCAANAGGFIELECNATSFGGLACNTSPNLQALIDAYISTFIPTCTGGPDALLLNATCVILGGVP